MDRFSWCLLILIVEDLIWQEWPMGIVGHHDRSGLKVLLFEPDLLIKGVVGICIDDGAGIGRLPHPGCCPGALPLSRTGPKKTTDHQVKRANSDNTATVFLYPTSIRCNNKCNRQKAEIAAENFEQNLQ